MREEAERIKRDALAEADRVKRDAHDEAERAKRQVESYAIEARLKQLEFSEATRHQELVARQKELEL